MKLEKIKDPAGWDFICKYYPGYAHANEIAHADDLQKILDNEVDEGSAAEDLLNREYEGMHDNPHVQDDYNELHLDLYERAAENYLEKHNQIVDLFNELEAIIPTGMASETLTKIKELLNTSEA